MMRWSLAFVGLCLASASWVGDEELKKQALLRTAVTPKTYVVNLDESPVQRWAFLASDPLFADYKQELTSYLGQFVPSSVETVLAWIAGSLKGKFYDEYADEMTGLADALGVSVGEIVLVNLIYQLEDIGVTCEKRNVTGPCPAKVAGPGLCTGLVANSPMDDAGPVWQGRNLDWNLDPSLLKYVMRVEYQRNGATVFTGVQIAGEVGVLHGMRPGAFSVQMNARNQGGNILSNLLEQIFLGSKTPSHIMRYALEHNTDFASAEKFLSTPRITNPVYFVMAGASHGEGVIVSRDRKDAADSWHMYETSAKDTQKVNVQPDWLRLQTNYDNWEAVPSYDDRRTPGVANTQMDCGSVVDETTVMKVMTTWPTFNHHTDVTSVMCAQTGYFDVTVWMPSTTAPVVVA